MCRKPSLLSDVFCSCIPIASFTVCAKSLTDGYYTLQNPKENPGKITLITRFGADKVSTLLPPILREVQKSGLPVVWCCDPCHGNTFTSKTGYKTRSFDSILREIEETFKVHRDNGSRLNGVHIELTGEHVTECTGGPEGLLETDLPRRYTTLCDPRLNYAQSLEVSLTEILLLDRRR